MILLIDNYDSFSYNLYQLIGSVEPDIKVIRNDSYTVEEIEKMNPAARYHSLAAVKETMPEELCVIAESEDGEIMAVEHKTYPIFGLQFHPESVMIPEGKKIIENFMEVVRND